MNEQKQRNGERVKRHYSLVECAELLDRPTNPFFMFGVDAGRFQIWECYRDGLLTRENAIHHIYANKWGL